MFLHLQLPDPVVNIFELYKGCICSHVQAGKRRTFALSRRETKSGKDAIIGPSLAATTENSGTAMKDVASGAQNTNGTCIT